MNDMMFIVLFINKTNIYENDEYFQPITLLRVLFVNIVQERLRSLYKSRYKPNIPGEKTFRICTGCRSF